MEFYPDFSYLTPTLLLTLLFGGMVLIQIVWIIIFILRLLLHKDVTSSTPIYPPVSIIIVATNEENALVSYLPTIMEQEYPNFEVIVIDNQSADNTHSVLKAFQKKYKQLEICTIERSEHLNYGKKLPITVGVKKAKNELLFFTEANCKPSSSQWLEKMVQQFTHSKEIVVGFSPHLKNKGWLNRMIRVDACYEALHYLSFAKLGYPVSGRGTNLAYKKHLFEENKGFKSNYHLPFGDNDILLQEMSHSRNSTISLSPDTYCTPQIEDEWSEWLFQKSRMVQSKKYYSLIKKLLLGTYSFSLLLIYISFVILTVTNGLNWTVVGLGIFLIVSRWLFIGLTLKRLQQRSLAWGVPLWDLFYVLIIPFIFYVFEKRPLKR